MQSKKEIEFEGIVLAEISAMDIKFGKEAFSKIENNRREINEQVNAHTTIYGQ